MFYWNTGIALEKESLYDFCCAVRAHQMMTNELTGQLRDNFKQAMHGLDEPTTPDEWTSGRQMSMEQFKNVSESMLDMLDVMDAQITAPSPVE